MLLYSIVVLCTCVSLQSADFIARVRILCNKAQKNVSTLMYKSSQLSVLDEASDMSSIQDALYKACIKNDVQGFFTLLNHVQNERGAIQYVISYDIIQSAYDHSRSRIFKKLLQSGLDLSSVFTDAFYKKYLNDRTFRSYVQSFIMLYPGVFQTPQFLTALSSILSSKDILLKEELYEYFQKGINPFVILCACLENAHKYISYFFHGYNARCCAQFFIDSCKSAKPVVFCEYKGSLFLYGYKIYILSPLALTSELVSCLISWMCYSADNYKTVVAFLVKNGWATKAIDDYNRTPLHRAVLAGSGCIVDAFLHDSDVTWTDDFKNTPLTYACLQCNKACIDVLVHNPFLVHTVVPHKSEIYSAQRLYSIRQNQKEKAILKYLCDLLALNSFIRGCSSAQTLCDCSIITQDV